MMTEGIQCCDDSRERGMVCSQGIFVYFVPTYDPLVCSVVGQEHLQAQIASQQVQIDALKAEVLRLSGGVGNNVVVFDPLSPSSSSSSARRQPLDDDDVERRGASTSGFVQQQVRSSKEPGSPNSTLPLGPSAAAADTRGDRGGVDGKRGSNKRGGGFLGWLLGGSKGDDDDDGQGRGRGGGGGDSVGAVEQAALNTKTAGD